MVQDDGRHRHESQQQDLDSQYRYPVSVEQAQEGVFLADGIGSHHSAIGLEHQDAVGAGGEGERDAEDAAGDVERVDGLAGFSQGSLMKVGGERMMEDRRMFCRIRRQSSSRVVVD